MSDKTSREIVFSMMDDVESIVLKIWDCDSIEELPNPMKEWIIERFPHGEGLFN